MLGSDEKVVAPHLKPGSIGKHNRCSGSGGDNRSALSCRRKPLKIPPQRRPLDLGDEKNIFRRDRKQGKRIQKPTWFYQSGGMPMVVQAVLGPFTDKVDFRAPIGQERETRMCDGRGNLVKKSLQPNTSPLPLGRKHPAARLASSHYILSTIAQQPAGVLTCLPHLWSKRRPQAGWRPIVQSLGG